MKTIRIPETLHRELINIKLEENKRNSAELIGELILEHKKKRFLEASGRFRKALKENKVGFAELLKKSNKIREEISDEWF